VQALKNYLAVRLESHTDILFLNYKDEPISERGIRKLVVKYRKNAGITKRASCHTLRHTFATYKAEKGVSPFQLQQWLGHANLNTTQIYVHLRVAGIFVRFYTLRHSTLFFNVLQRNITDFSTTLWLFHRSY